MSPQQESEDQNCPLKLGDRVESKNITGLQGSITSGPLMYGGDWTVTWDDWIDSDEYCADLVKLNE